VNIPTFTVLGGGPTVLMLHGIVGGHLAFAPQVESLATAGYRAVAWDMPGYGRSAPIEPYTFKGLAQSCVALIEALLAGEDGGAESVGARRRPGRVTLLGHSIGGMVALEVVARRPDLVNRLILCGTTPSFGQPDGDWQREFITHRTAPLDAGRTMADLADVLVPQMVGPASLTRRRAPGDPLHEPGPRFHLSPCTGGAVDFRSACQSSADPCAHAAAGG
jgi:pimeloyl-ACP methyl ester carboxylesterase